MKGWKLFILTASVATGGFLLVSWRQKASNLAAQFIDIKEIGDNAGFTNQVFTQMMQSVGWQGGEAWCMYFAKSIYIQAFPQKADRISKILSGSTQLSWISAKANSDVFKVVTDGPPQRGDIIIWQDVNNSSTGHAGIAYKKQKGRIWQTIEGNTTLSDLQAGQGISKKTRDLTQGAVEGNLRLLGFLRLKTTLF